MEQPRPWYPFLGSSGLKINFPAEGYFDGTSTEPFEH